MSHVTTIDPKEHYEIPALKKMCENQGWAWMEGQQTYKWFGTHVGDYPLPTGFTKEDMGKCDHAIRVPGARYEIGVVQKDEKWQVIYDFYDRSLKEKLCPDPHNEHGEAGLLKQAYNIAKTQVACKSKMKSWTQGTVKNREGWQQMTVSMGGW